MKPTYFLAAIVLAATVPASAQEDCDTLQSRCRHSSANARANWVGLQCMRIPAREVCQLTANCGVSNCHGDATPRAPEGAPAGGSMRRRAHKSERFQVGDVPVPTGEPKKPGPYDCTKGPPVKPTQESPKFQAQCEIDQEWVKMDANPDLANDQAARDRIIREKVRLDTMTAGCAAVDQIESSVMSQTGQPWDSVADCEMFPIKGGNRGRCVRYFTFKIDHCSSRQRNEYTHLLPCYKYLEQKFLYEQCKPDPG